MRVLFLDLDTLRPDHLGCYGYQRNTSPNLDRIASEGVRFDKYYVTDAPCLPARSALFSGRFGIHNGAIGHGGTAADQFLDGSPRGFRQRLDQECLPRILRNEGMKTASISPFGERHSSFWFYAGFNEMHNTGGGGGESAEEVTPVALKWIEDNASDDDWMLHINYWDPHTNYRAPEEFGNPFEKEPLPEWLTEEVVAAHQNVVGPHSAREINMYNSDPTPHLPRHCPEVTNMEQLRKHIDGYDCGIAYMDQHIGMLLDALEKKGVLDDLVIIVTSDHGENQGELGIYAEHGTADHATHRIPMIIRWPGQKQGHVDTGLHYNIDLAPTLADMLGQEAKPGWDGSSYAESIRTGADTGRESLILSQGAHICQRSARFGPWLYMRTYHDGFRLFPDEMLFNIDEDPHEQHDIAKDNPDVCREGAWHLLNWWGEMMKTSTTDRDPLFTVIREGGPEHCRGRLPAYCERLEATGRGWAVEELKKRHPQEFA